MHLWGDVGLIFDPAVFARLARDGARLAGDSKGLILFSCSFMGGSGRFCPIRPFLPLFFVLCLCSVLDVGVSIFSGQDWPDRARLAGLACAFFFLVSLLSVLSSFLREKIIV